MLKGSVKLLIYDLLDLIDKGEHESCEEIERGLSNGRVIPYLLTKYNMSCFSKTNTQEVSDLLKNVASDCNEYNYKNGLIYLIDILLDF